MASEIFSVREAAKVQGRFQTIAPWLSRMVMMPPLVILTIVSIRFLTKTAEVVPGVTLRTPEAFTDMRVPAAWLLTTLAMLLIFVSDQKRLWLGQVQLCLVSGLTLVVRVYGFLHDGTTLAMGNQRRITIAEVVFLLLNAVALAMQAYLRKQTAVRP